jgi:signal transduction histidine kinase
MRIRLIPLKTNAQAALDKFGVRAQDAVLALAITALLQAELWLGERYQGSRAFPGPRGVDAVLLAIAGLALAWRRRFPLRAFAVVTGALMVESIVGGGPEAGGSFLILLVAVYSAAAYGDRPLLVATIAAAAVAVHDITDPFVQGIGDVLFAPLFAIVAFGFGRAVHGRRIRSALLAEETTRLQSETDERARQAVVEERSRIARELHDIIAHSVSLMVVQAIAGQRAEGAEAAQGALSSIESTGREAMAEMRRLLAILHEADDGRAPPQPGLEQLPALVEEVERAGLNVELVERGERPALSPGLELALFRITQEALTNSLKHAGQTRVEIELGYRDHEVELSVRDHGGSGEHGDGPWSGGNGLAGMRERAAIYGGELRTTRRNGGFELAVRLPLAEQGK